MHKKEFVILIIMTTIVILVWVVSDIYHTKANVVVSPKLQEVLEPINPNLDQAALDEIKKNSTAAGFIVVPVTENSTSSSSQKP
ncbi:hypothetical protein HY025_03415 [Candidatus Daviesbacteria bacterium]|nr:hypothetical protein [Candidatus Daviesbacteria bacterium]